MNSKIDILNNELYLSKIHRVVSSHLPNGFLQGVVPRYSDGLICIHQGCCTYTFQNGTAFTAEAGQLIYLAKGALYDMDIPSERYAFTFLDFDFSDARHRQSAVYSPSDTAKLRFRFQALTAAFEKKQPGWECKCAAIFYRLYGSLIEARANYAPMTARRLAETAQGIFLENLSRPDLSVQEVARQLNISPTHLRRSFHGVFGIPPVRYIRQARISRATNLMTVSGLSIEEIAWQCGYSSYPYFYRVFREVTGTTPGKYRENLHNKSGLP